MLYIVIGFINDTYEVPENGGLLQVCIQADLNTARYPRGFTENTTIEVIVNSDGNDRALLGKLRT